MYVSVQEVAPMAIEEQAPAGRATITVEHGLYSLILALSLGLRVFALDSQPLHPLEAASAWPAWLSSQALTAPNPPQPVSALLYSYQVGALWLTQGGEFSMRLLPALLGAGMAFLPWFWRRWLGRSASLAAAGLIAIDPWLLALSRTADGAMLSTFLGVLTLTALLHLQEDQSEADGPRSSSARWQATAGVAVGLLLVSGVQAWSWLLLAVAFVGILGVHRFHSFFRWSTLVWGAGAAALAATRWFTQPQDLAIVSASLSDWLAQVWSAGYPLAYPWVRLAVDQPFLVVFAFVGVLSAGQTRFVGRTAENRRLIVFWLLWLVLSLLLLLAPGRTPYALPMLSLALILPASLGVAALAQLVVQEEDWREGGLLLAVLSALLLSLLFWLTAVIYSRSPEDVLIRAVLVLVLLGIALVVAFAVWISRRQAFLVALALTGVALLFASFSAAWRLNFEHDPRRLAGFFLETTHPDVRQLAADVARVSAHRLGDATELPVQIVTGAGLTPDPAVSWALRRMRNLSWPPAAEPTAESDPRRAPAILVPSGDPGPMDSDLPYIGSDYRVKVRWLPTNLPALTGEGEGSLWAAVIRPWLRWAIYREASVSPQAETVTLWTLGE